MARAAKARGYEYIAITDHSRSLKFAGGVSVEDLRAHADAVRALADRVGIRVLIGSEVDILPDGSLDYPDEVLQTLDLVIGSRSEEHTSELQSHLNLVCRLLL